MRGDDSIPVEIGINGQTQLGDRFGLFLQLDGPHAQEQRVGEQSMLERGDLRRRFTTARGQQVGGPGSSRIDFHILTDGADPGVIQDRFGLAGIHDHQPVEGFESRQA